MDLFLGSGEHLKQGLLLLLLEVILSFRNGHHNSFNEFLLLFSLGILLGTIIE
jgi:hypothetical protein